MLASDNTTLRIHSPHILYELDLGTMLGKWDINPEAPQPWAADCVNTQLMMHTLIPQLLHELQCTNETGIAFNHL